MPLPASESVRIPESSSNGALTFPSDFLWGTATSTTQIEGQIENEWTHFIARDGSHCRTACDSYHRYAEDIEGMRQLGVNTYRFGVEWSRLQTEAFGSLRQNELARYLDQLERLNAAGITPMVVLNHFSNPPWINARGAWTQPETIAIFVDYVEKLVETLRGHVRFWNTFNEPDTYGCCGYLIGEFPPERVGRLDQYRAVIRHMADAHRRACAILRAAGSPLGNVEVGFSKNWTYFAPHHRLSPWDTTIAWLTHAQLNDFVLETFLGGSGRDASTFLGVNYYGRIRFKGLRALTPTCGFPREELARMGVFCDDMLERFPEGLERALVLMHKRAGLPIYITEHGSSSSDHAFRERDLRGNLAAVHRAMRQGVDVRGFYYWSLLDNFEWQFGYSKKFGLLSVDFQDPTLPRRMKPLAETYRRICQTNSLQS